MYIDCYYYKILTHPRLRLNAVIALNGTRKSQGPTKTGNSCVQGMLTFQVT